MTILLVYICVWCLREDTQTYTDEQREGRARRWNVKAEEWAPTKPYCNSIEVMATYCWRDCHIMFILFLPECLNIQRSTYTTLLVMFTPLHVCASFKPFFFLGIPVWHLCVLYWVSCDLKLILFYICTACITAKNCNPRNVTSVAVWIPSMQWPTSFRHWCYHGFSVTPNVQSSFLEKTLQMKFIL